MSLLGENGKLSQGTSGRMSLLIIVSDTISVWPLGEMLKSSYMAIVQNGFCFLDINPFHTNKCDFHVYYKSYITTSTVVCMKWVNNVIIKYHFSRMQSSYYCLNLLCHIICYFSVLQNDLITIQEHCLSALLKYIFDDL